MVLLGGGIVHLGLLQGRGCRGTVDGGPLKKKAPPFFRV